MSVRQNVVALKAAVAAPESHPLCARIERQGRRAIVVYPAGDFPVDGVRTDWTARGLAAALIVMDRHWRESAPGFTR
jgi:hypothetical protein